MKIPAGRRIPHGESGHEFRAPTRIAGLEALAEGGAVGESFPVGGRERVGRQFGDQRRRVVAAAGVGQDLGEQQGRRQRPVSLVSMAGEPFGRLKADASRRAGRGQEPLRVVTVVPVSVVPVVRRGRESPVMTPGDAGM